MGTRHRDRWALGTHRAGGQMCVGRVGPGCANRLSGGRMRAGAEMAFDPRPGIPAMG